MGIRRRDLERVDRSRALAGVRSRPCSQPLARPFLALILAALILLTGQVASMPLAAAQEPASPEPTDEPATAESAALAELAQRYAPRIVVRDQAEVCGPGEPYQPTAVSDVLGRDDVILRRSDADLPSPTAADLAASDAETHLDLPGQPLDPGCDYEQWSQALSPENQPTLYANAANDPGYPGQLALQYWFYWVFNDWNNRHEGDWEMIQLVFPASTAAEAIGTEPTSVAFAQHEGSETADWNDPKLRKDGIHPVVYPSEGSHAAYFDQANWFGKSAAAGFGCDDTSVSPTVPGTMWEPEIRLLTDPANGGPQWLTYPGHWGQQAPAFNNGPTGPSQKRQWTEPIAWQIEEGRSGAVAIPAIPGPAVSTFCGVTTAGSLLFLRVLDQPVLTVAVVVVAVVLLIALIRGTAWRGAQPGRPDLERQSGQILTAAIGVYLRRLPSFAVLGLVFLVGSGLAAWLSERILATAATESLVDTAGTTDSAVLALSAFVTTAIRGPIVVLVIAAAMAVVAYGVSGPAALVRAIKPPTASLLLAGTYLVVTLLAATVVLLPVALWLMARWASVGPAAMVEGRSAREALARSVELTRRRRVRTLLLTSWSFTLVNALVVVSFAVALPILGVALTLQFYDLRQEQARDFDNDSQLR